MVHLLFISVIAMFGLAGCAQEPAVAIAAPSPVPAPVPAPEPRIVAAPPPPVKAAPVRRIIVDDNIRAISAYETESEYARTRAEPVRAAPAPARKKEEEISSGPAYTYRLTNAQIKRNQEEVLSVAVSSKLSQYALSQLLTERQKNLPATLPVTDSGSLQISHLAKFKYIRAKISCPTFLSCEGSLSPKSTADDTLVWEWTLKGIEWDETQRGSIFVGFYGGQNVEDKFDEEIVTLPPLSISVQLHRNMEWWERRVIKSKELVMSIKDLLVALAALATLVLGWFRWKNSRK